MNRAALILTSLAAGIIAGYYGATWLTGLAVICAGVAVRLLIAVMIRRNPLNFTYATRLHYVWPCLVFIGIGVCDVARSLEWPSGLPDNLEAGFTVRVRERVAMTSGDRYLVDILDYVTAGVENASSPVRCRGMRGYLYLDPAEHRLPGDILHISATVRRLENSRPGGAGYMLRIFGRPHTVDDSRRGSLHNRVSALRDDFIIFIERSPLGRDTTGLLRALLAGDTGGLDQAQIGSMRDAGVAHSIAVSGMHVGILTVVLLWLTMPLNLWHGRRVRYALVLAGVWIFVLLSGVHFSTLRAALMFSFVALAVMTERRRNAFSMLCFATMLILLVNPVALWDVGLQLSFACVAALTLFVEPLIPVDHRNHPVAYRLSSMALTTLVATGATWVLTAYYFSSVPVHFMVSNLVILPLLPLFLVAGSGLLLLHWLGVDVSTLAVWLEELPRWMYRLTGAMRGSALTVEVTSLIVWCWIGGLALLALSLHWRRSTAPCLPGAIPRGDLVRYGDSPPPFMPLLLPASALLLLSIILTTINSGAN